MPNYCYQNCRADLRVPFSEAHITRLLSVCTFLLARRALRLAPPQCPSPARPSMMPAYGLEESFSASGDIGGNAAQAWLFCS